VFPVPERIHGVAVVFENVCNGLPAGTVGERAMDNNNILDRSMSQGCQGDAEYGKGKR